MSVLVDLNNFVANEHSVYCSNDSLLQGFGYSDGESTEAYLDDVLSNAGDLTSASQELHSKIKDWPSEYHLSGLRSNLLKSLNLSKTSRVLELGCGCGAISRYLGELGIQVDAVEGSPIRAKLAALRCRDLPNVTVSTANFNDLVLPHGYYDAVLYIGVTEYAGRFSEAKSDQDAVIQMLTKAKASVIDDGFVVVAIENRLGIKYLLGAHEDHYGKAFVGVNNYPEVDGRREGMRTYSYEEWKVLLSSSGLPDSTFLLPFPDYKVPTAVLPEDYYCEPSAVGEAREGSEHGKSVFNKIHSFDYTSDFFIGAAETYLWQGIGQGKALKQFANSYLIVASGTNGVSSDIGCSSPCLYDDYRALYPENTYTEYLNTKAQAKHLNDWQVEHDLAVKSGQINKLKQDLSLVRKNLQRMTSSRIWRLLTRFDSLLKSLGLRRS